MNIIDSHFRKEWTSWRGERNYKPNLPQVDRWKANGGSEIWVISMYIYKTNDFGGRNMKYCTTYEFTCVNKHTEILAPRTECIN